MQIEALVTPFAPDNPAGPDLSYDSGRQVIEGVFDAPGEESDWPRVIAMIEAQARATRDVWLAIYLARAGAYAGDLQVVEDGAELLAGLFEQLWDTVHPALDDYGIEGRKGACESLVRIGEFLAPLRRVPLLRHLRLGEYSGGDFERFARDGAGEEGYGQFRAALADTSAEHLSEIRAQLERIRGAIGRADAVLSDRAQAQGQTGTNFESSYAVLDALIGAVGTYIAPPVPGAADMQGAAMSVDDGGRPVDAVAGAGGGAPGRIHSRDDVARSIDAIIDYFSRVEPSSPIPVALLRIKGWLAMDFVAILNDIAPNSVSEATNILKARAEQANNSSSSDMM